MQIIRNLNQIKTALPPLALTIGNFDGVHLGHLAIVSEIKKIAKEKNLASAILTFEPHPISFFKPNAAKDFRISSLAQKLRIFQKHQIDYVIILPFNQNFSEISAEDFVKNILVQALNIKHLTIGYDFIFGKNRQGDFKLLEKEAKVFDFGLSEVSVVKNLDQNCSSSLIRKLISEGKIAEANFCLGKNFAISGLVNEGRKLASQLGFATANLAVKPHIIKPKFGVYKSSTFIVHLNKTFASITNFGVKPTVSGDLIPLFETHIPNFSQNIYGKKIHVELLEFIREEKKFSSLEELKLQIARDVSELKMNL
ncbi:MAG: bifunctional riboflavin kinase/FAD synthetase [Rickettsiales bacterium]|nr:bifunctional riboflavin kinase/FAD synthetase [Rickettsiales bacterium]